MGQNHLQQLICIEADELIENLENQCIYPINTSVAFIKAVSNVVVRLTFNEPNRYDDPLFERYIQCVKVLAHSNVLDNR